MEKRIMFFSSLDQEGFSISFEQERMWFLEQLSPGNSAYNIRAAIQIKGLLNADILEQSINEIVRRHEILRTTFHIVDGQPKQIIGSPFKIELPVIDLQKLSATEREQEVYRLATQIVLSPFNLSLGPLWRVCWLLLEETQHILVLSMHHIVCDGDRSIGIFFQELAALYKAFSSSQESGLVELPIQYKEYALGQRQQLEEILKTQLTYWKQQLGDNLPVLQLPTDRPRQAIGTYAGASQQLKLSQNLSEKLKLLSQQKGVTLKALLLAAFKTLLYRYTTQEDIIVGSPASGRNLPETQELIGYFGNPLVLRTDMSGNPTFLELLSRVDQVISQAYKHQDYPFQKLVEELKLQRDLALTPLFQVLFLLRDDLMPTLELSCFTLTPIDVESTSVPYDLCIFIKDTDLGLVWNWEYNIDLFEDFTITSILKHLQNLLESIVANPEERIGSLPLLSQGERHQLLWEWNNTLTEYTQTSVHKLVETQVEKNPAAVAVVWENQQLTYRELNERANQLAHYLQKLGVKPEEFVGIYIERSPQMMVAILGVLKAGGAYVPLDPAYPKERLSYILSDVNLQILLTTETVLLASLGISEIAKNQEIVCLDSDWEIISQLSDENPVSLVQPHNLAYIIYTSGSTGKPKGVMMEHLALCNLIDWHLQNRTKGVTTLQFAPLSFDISFHEIFSTWCSLGTLVLISEEVRRNPEALLNLIRERRIEKLYLPFVALQQLAEVIDSQSVPTTVREVMTAGEQLQITPKIANFFKQTDCILHNHYGATECQDVTTFTLTGDANTWSLLPPIGRPINNIQIYILDEFYQPVAIGATGELYIGGDGIARGYFNQPSLTHEKFIPNPFGTGRLYKTGDLARYLSDAKIEHLGRSDRQVKIRGFRIELGEIEGLLAKHPTVLENAVIASEDVPGNKRLIAYVVCVQSEVSNQLELTLRNYLKENLPDYMVPTAIVMLDKMPLTPSGKVDRRALPLPDKSRPELEGALVMPQSETEKLIAQAWIEVLGLEEVGIHDNFFELGGNSLLLIQVHKKLIEIFGSSLSAVTLFQYPTIYALAEHLSQTQADKPTVKRYKSGGRRIQQRSDIAIISISGRFPGAENIEAFWQNLRSGVESISLFSNEEIEIHDLSLLNQPNYVKVGAVLPNIEEFDAEFFGYTAKEAEIMDPQQRILLECVWEALESAGYNPKTYEGLVGLYAGSGMSSYLINNVCPSQGFSPRHPFLESNSLQMRLGNDRNYLLTRISYKLSLTGPSVNIQTACSTSLVAVHIACQSLQNGECDMALAGGVSIAVPQKVGYLYQEGMIHSPDGCCRAFDEQAQGTIFGNGAGIVLLKRLDEAIADGDDIYAVIKGSAINNDGDLKVGYTAPSVEGQAAAIAEALAVAEIDASTVSYVETHGTATPLGDPIEIAALTQAFRQSTSSQKNGFCAIGSVKTNVGHLDEAAGIASLIKTVLALKYQYIPPSLHFKQPNPNINFANSPFYVNTTLTEWKTNGMPRRAGVSSFGMGGTNCHVVLEEAPEEVKSQKSKGASALRQLAFKSDRTLHILTLSAKTDKALEELAQRYVIYLNSDVNADIADICFTANTGREHFNHRIAVVAESKKQLLEQLISFVNNQSKPKGYLRKGTSKKRIAFLFTGQGSQQVGMGRQLYETQPTFRQILARCDEILRPYLEVPLLEILYPDSETNNTKINETAYTQPALFALEYALFQLWKSWGIEPDVVMGHSIGEYVAACIAGVFSLEDGLKLIAARGKLMQALPADGEMVALSASESQALAAIAPYSKSVSIAAINAPQSVVISGGCEAINTICANLSASGIKTKKLNVSHAFHSPLMEPMLGEFELVARQVSFSLPQIKLLSNVTGIEVTEEITTPEYWCRHVLQPVKFAASMKSLEQQGIEVFVEMGAKPILLGMGRQCLQEDFGLWLPSLRPEREDWQELLTSLAQMYLNGVPIDWVGFDQDFTRHRVRLPTYPFQRQRYWVEAPKDNGTQALSLTNNLVNSNHHTLLGQQLSLPGTQQIRYQGQISKNLPAWLRDHRVFETTIVPGTAYIEMALAAGVAVNKTDNFALEDVIIRQALVLPENDEPKLIQLVLTPQGTNSHSFEIFSLEPPTLEDKGQLNWRLHASGKLLVRDKQSQADAIDLATIKTQCTEEIPVDLLYLRYQEQKIDYGSSFRAVEQLWRHETVALGKISLPQQLRAQVGDYQLHPVLLDACLQILDATLPEDNNQNTYVPVGVERLQVYTRPSTEIWCYAQLRQVEEQRQQNLSADLHLLTSNGDLVASVKGLQLKHAPREAMLGTAEKSWLDWLYEVEWRPQGRFGIIPDYLPTPAEVGNRLQSMLAQLMSHPSLTVYGEALTQIEAMSVTYILKALQEMGWEFHLHKHFSTVQIAESLQVVSGYRQLLDRLLEILAEVGILQREGSHWQTISLPEVRDQKQQTSSLSYPEVEAEITLLNRCGSSLAQVLRGECDPLQLLFPNGDTTTLTKLYRESPMVRVTNTLVQEAVLLAKERLPQRRGWRILEIGAGTGSTTNYILPHLFPERTEYVFTDIGAFFIAKAQEKFKDYPFIRYQVLNIELDPQNQGFSPHQFDIIVAANVLHATSDLRVTLQHVQQLLVPSGMLVLMEDTAPLRWVDLTFGLTPGWWKFSDHELRPSHPLLSVSQWLKLLQETGFTQTVNILPALEASQQGIFLPHESVIVAQAEAKHQIGTPRNWLILADTQGTGQQLGELLRSWGDICTLVFCAKEYKHIGEGEFSIDPANPNHFQQLLQAIPTVARVAHLWSLDAPTVLSGTDLEDTSLKSCGSTLYLVQALIKNYAEPPCLWLVTRGAQAVNGHHVQQVAQSPLWGMGKVIAIEHPELNCIRVDLDPLATGNEAQSLFEEIISSLSAQDIEDQVAFRDGNRYVARLVHHRQNQKTSGKTKLDVPENQPFRLELSERGVLDNLKVQVTTRQKPEAGEIEIRVRNVGLNFIDLLNAMGLSPVKLPLGLECAGEVVAFGEEVKGFELGEPVIALASGSFSQYVTTNANLVVPKPAALTFEEAATIPEAFVTAYWCLHHVAKISAGNRVLIHAAAGGVGQAAVQLAIQAGAEVFATASPSKWHVLKSLGVKYIMNSRTLDFASEVMAYTNGQGVDIILNSLTSDGFVQKSLAVVSDKGCFVELAKRDIWSSDQVVHVRPDVRYFMVDTGQVRQEQPALIQSILRQLIQQFEDSVLKPLPQTVFPLQDAVSAFRYMQQAKHIGKIVIKFPEKMRTQERLTFRSDGTYLITGGLGGLGLLIAQWLVEQGAKHLVLVSRSAYNPNDSNQLEKLEQTGAFVRVVQADVSDSEQVARVLSEIEQSSPPLRGIIHAAGVLNDGVLLQQNWQRFDRVLAPKVQGAWNLHTLTQNRSLDFFVLFSSATSLLGNAGQANHAAANAFLDALSSYRRMQGLPSLSINWGAWAEVGATARMGLVEQLSLKGEESIAPQQGLQVLERLLLNPPVQVGVMPVNWSRFLQQRRALEPFFTDFIKTSFQQSEQRTELEFRKQLETVPAVEGKALLVAHVKSQVAQVLGLHLSNPLDFTQGFFTLGMDSLTSIELRSRLQSSLGCSLPSTITFDYPTVEALVNYLMEKVLSSASSEELNKGNKNVNSALTQVQELSESEAEALLLKELENLNY